MKARSEPTRRRIRIVNWERFQHYQHRNPPWIKLHRQLLNSRTWVASDDSTRVLAIALMLLARDTDNQIPIDTGYIRRVAYLNQEPDFSTLLATQFIEIVDECGSVHTNASESHTNASKLRTNADSETETETETEKKNLSSKLEISFDQALLQVWDHYLEALQKNPKLYRFSAVRKNKGLARLRECYDLAAEPKLENAVNLMKLCVDRFSQDAFHTATTSTEESISTGNCFFALTKNSNIGWMAPISQTAAIKTGASRMGTPAWGWANDCDA